jgi:hypothetical protein
LRGRRASGVGRRVGILVAILVANAAASPIDDLGADDPRPAIAAIERGPADADALFAAARACEDRLHDPARAAALYERIVHELPDARLAIPAGRRAEQLREQLGVHGEFAQQASALAELIATAGSASEDVITASADSLAHDAWPGAPDAELWLAEWLRGRGSYEAAQARYTDLARRWPGSPQAIEAARDAAGCALDARDWDRAERLARELPGGNPVEDAARAELLAAAKRGRSRDLFATAAWLALALAALVLLASLADAVLRGGRRWPSLRPPIEVMFLAPIAGVLAAVAFFTQRTIAPAVTRISLVGVSFAWLSGASLDLLRSRGRATRARSLVHVAACALGVLAIAYVTLVRDGLLDMLVETARNGPEP